MGEMSDYKKVDTSINSVNFIELARSSGNIYKTVAILGARSNVLSKRYKEELSTKLSDFATNSDSLEEIQENREQIEIARSYEGLPKATLIALSEYFEGKLLFKDGTDPLY